VRNFRESFFEYLSDTGFNPETTFANIFNLPLIKASKNIYFKLNSVYPDSGKENEMLFHESLDKKIRIIEIWEDQWMKKREIVQSRVNAILGKAVKIYGRETQVIRLSNHELFDFLDQNHLSVPIKGKYRFGLTHRGKLVTVISFSYPRNFKPPNKRVRSFEILRFGHINGHLVIGGLSKLIHFFISNYNVGHLMSYTDNDWGLGNGFEKIGFQRSDFKKHQPLYVDVHTFERIHKSRQIISNSTGKDDGHPTHIKIFNSGSTKYTRFIE